MSIQLREIRSLKDLGSSRIPKYMFEHIKKGAHLSTEWSSPELSKFSGFIPINIFGEGGKVTGIILWTPDFKKVLSYGWGSPVARIEVQKMIKGLFTSTWDIDPWTTY